MINTFLFDLDGTLLPLDMEIFEKEYFKRLGAKLSGHFDPQLLVKQIWKSTMKMVKNTGGQKTNEEVFYEDFVITTGKDIKTLGPIFDEFYDREYKELGLLVKSESYVVKTINLLIDRGYEVVVATNPLFPLKAIKHRIRWAGLNEGMFKYITCFEEMHYCKPNVEFYSEVLGKIGRRAEECIMVGNDVEEDLIASQLGIKTFLVKDYMINRGKALPSADYQGSYVDLYKIVENNFPGICR